MPRAPIVLCGAAFTIGALFAPLPLPIVLAATVLLGLWTWRARARPAALFCFVLTLGAAVVSLRVPDSSALRARADGGPARPLRARIAEIPERTAAGLSLIVEPADGHGARARLAIDTPCGGVGDTIEGQARLDALETTRMPAFRARSLGIMRGVVASGGLTGCRVIDEHAPPARDALIRALTFADRGGLDDRHLDALLTRAGQTHLLALGGLTQLAASMLLAFALLILFPARLRLVALVLAAVGAAAFTVHLGATPTHLRVATLVACLLAARAAGFGPRDGLATCAALVSAVDPFGLGDTAFQLAFAATTAATGLAPVLGARWDGVGSAIVRGLPATAIAVVVGTAPLVLRQFDRISVLSLAAGVLTFPAAILTGIAGLTDAPVAGPLTALIERLPHVAALGTPTVVECVLGYLALAAFAAQPRTARTRGAAVFALVLLVVVAGAPRLERRFVAQPRVTVLPVARGHAVLAELGHGHTVLIGADGSGGADPDAPARMITALLRLRHITQLDAVLGLDPRTLALLGHTYELPRASDLAVDGVVITPQAIIIPGEAPIAITTSTRTAAPWAIITSSAAPARVRTPDGALLSVDAVGMITLRDTPWRDEVYLPAGKIARN